MVQYHAPIVLAPVIFLMNMESGLHVVFVEEAENVNVQAVGERETTEKIKTRCLMLRRDGFCLYELPPIELLNGDLSAPSLRERLAVYIETLLKQMLYSLGVAHLSREELKQIGVANRV